MKPVYLLLEDFMGHKFTEVDCTQFRSVLIVARDKNKPRQSNGAGKTTIFTAIEYALFGSPLKHIDNLVRKTETKCKVIFDFEVGNEIYRVVRTRNKKTSKSDIRLFKKHQNDWIDITQKTSSETEKELAKLIKISYGAFKSAVLFSQMRLSDLMDATSKERKNLLKEPLQIGIYNKYEKIAKMHADPDKEQIDQLRFKINAIGNPEIDLVRWRQEVELNTIDLSIKEKDFAALKEAIHFKQMELAETQKLAISDVSGLQIELADLQRQSKELQIKFNSSKEIEQYTARDIIEQERLLAKIETSIINLTKSLEDAQKKKLRPTEEVKKELALLNPKEIDGMVLIKKLTEDQKKLSVSLKKENTCSSCQQAITEEYRHACESKRQDDLKKVISDLEKYNKMLAILRAKKLKLEEESTAIHNHDCFVLKYDSDNQSLISKKEQIVKTIEQLKETINSKQNEQIVFLDSKNSLSPRIEKLQLEIEARDDKKIKFQIESLKSEIKILNDKFKLLENEISNHKTIIGILTNKIADLELVIIKLAEFKKELSKLEKQYFLRQKVQQAFGPSGIPTMIINTILDDLQITANKELAEIRPGIELAFSVVKEKNGQQEDTLDLTYRINGSEREYEEVSGGQKMMIALALKLALSSIIQHRVGIDIKFLELDEADAHFDPDARDAYAEVIKKWQSKFTIFVITHDDYLKDKFSHALLIESDENNGACGKLVTAW